MVRIGTLLVEFFIRDVFWFQGERMIAQLPQSEAEQVALTGTDDRSEKGASRKRPPMLPPSTAQSGHSESSSVVLELRSIEDPDSESIDVNCPNTNEKGPLSTIDNGPLLRVSNRVRTGDLRNHNPAL